LRHRKAIYKLNVLVLRQIGSYRFSGGRAMKGRIRANLGHRADSVTALYGVYVNRVHFVPNREVNGFSRQISQANEFIVSEVPYVHVL
jgi:hypothetical protein